jgi:hypothetical protein
MKLASFEAVVTALEGAGVRYLVAGGLAVNAHGYLRFTHDVDLVIQLRPDNIIPAFLALASLGYQPRVPVTAEQFADETQRRQWISEKGMLVLNFHSDRHRETPLAVFVSDPDDAWEQTTWEGNRRAQLRLALCFTLRERMQAVEDMGEVAERFRQMRESGKLSATRSGQGITPESEARTVRQPPTPYGSNDE